MVGVLQVPRTLFRQLTLFVRTRSVDFAQKKHVAIKIATEKFNCWKCEMIKHSKL